MPEKFRLVRIFLTAQCLCLLCSCNVFWTSPPEYTPASYRDWKGDILSNEEYSEFGDHERPFIFTIKGRGKAVVLGLEHTKNEKDAGLDSIAHYFHLFNPSHVFIEGRLGFLINGIQNPVKKYGEQGFTARLAKKNNTKLFTWEPSKDIEIKMMVNKFGKKKTALFYSIRPYFSNFRHGKPENPEKTMDNYIKSRTKHALLKNEILGWQYIDSIWQSDFSHEINWRDYSDEYGWPQGYLADMSSFNNMIRDIHLCQIIVDLVNRGETVLLTVGSSHAVKIKHALTSYYQDVTINQK